MTENGQSNEEYTLRASSKLGQAFERVISKNYGQNRAPEPIVTPTGIRHLDALLGGGIVSSGPVVVTSTPESGLNKMPLKNPVNSGKPVVP